MKGQGCKSTTAKLALACFCLSLAPGSAVDVAFSPLRDRGSRGHAEVISGLGLGASGSSGSFAARRRDDNDDNDDVVDDKKSEDDEEDKEEEERPVYLPDPRLPSGAGSATKAAVTAARWKEDVGEAEPMPPTLEPGSTAEKAAIVVATRRLLQENRAHQATLRGLVSELENSTHFHQQLQEEVSKASNETSKNKAVVEVLGKMWAEMRRYSSPFFLDHAKRQEDWLEHREPELNDELGAAEAALRSHYRKVTVDAPEDGFAPPHEDVQRSEAHKTTGSVLTALLLISMTTLGRSVTTTDA